jgi:hypothetical protein
MKNINMVLYFSVIMIIFDYYNFKLYIKRGKLNLMANLTCHCELKDSGLNRNNRIST